MSIFIFFVVLLVLVLVHEFGHFSMAKKFGIRVDEFGFGFPPKLFGIKKGETEYTFNLLPIGGFVKIFGENPDDLNTNGPDASRSFVHKPAWQQSIVLVAGVVANLLLAWILFSVGFMSGLPTSVGSEAPGAKLTDVNLVIVSVTESSPAQKAGLASGDKIISLVHSHPNGQDDILTKVSPDGVKNFIHDHKGAEIELTYLRGKNPEIQVAKVQVGEVKGTPAIGIAMDEIGIAKMPFFASFWEGAKLTVDLTKSTFKGILRLFWDGIKGKGSLDGVSGPVGMVGIVGDAYSFGLVYLLSFAALISINLAVINLLPFPALDGGRLFFILIEKIKGSAINPKIVNSANTLGFTLLLIMMLLVTYHDVVKLF